MEPKMDENVKVTVDRCFNMIENRIEWTMHVLLDHTNKSI